MMQVKVQTGMEIHPKPMLSEEWLVYSMLDIKSSCIADQTLRGCFANPVGQITRYTTYLCIMICFVD